MKTLLAAAAFVAFVLSFAPANAQYAGVVVGAEVGIGINHAPVRPYYGQPGYGQSVVTGRALAPPAFNPHVHAGACPQSNVGADGFCHRYLEPTAAEASSLTRPLSEVCGGNWGKRVPVQLDANHTAVFDCPPEQR